MTILHADDSTIHRAARALADGHLVAFPTETVYGLGADGLNPQAAQRIFEVKGRPADHPVILHVASVMAAKSLTLNWSAAADRLTQEFWPGPLTLILKRAANVPDIVTGGQDTVGVRMPSHPVAIQLLTEFAKVGSGVVAAPSANRFGAVSPTRAADVAASIGDRLSEHDLILDGGSCDVGVESTIVDLSGSQPRLLRPGGIARQAIERVLGQSFEANHADVPRVSGSLESHYAPNARALLVLPEEMDKIVRQELLGNPSSRIWCLMISDSASTEIQKRRHKMPADPVGYAHGLYAVLNDADRQGVEMILIESPPQTPEWEAVNDRLKRASAV